jgi:hypothetical protein
MSNLLALDYCWTGQGRVLVAVREKPSIGDVIFRINSPTSMPSPTSRSAAAAHHCRSHLASSAAAYLTGTLGLLALTALAFSRGSRHDIATAVTCTGPFLPQPLRQLPPAPALSMDLRPRAPCRARPVPRRMCAATRTSGSASSVAEESRAQAHVPGNQQPIRYCNLLIKNHQPFRSLNLPSFYAERNGISSSTSCVVTYEDGEGDWMLAGDLPWE